MQAVNSALETLIGNDHRWPVAKILVFDTTKSVPSKGFNAAYYGIDIDTSMSADWWSGLAATYPADRDSEGTFLAGSNIVEPSTVLAFDWGIGGVPAPISDGRVDLWAARWFGHFYARYTGTYRFYVDSSPHSRIRVKLNGSYRTLKDADAADTERWDDADLVGTKQELYFDIALTENNWYDIQIEYSIPQQSAPQNAQNYMCVKYSEPDATTAYDSIGNTGGDIVGDYQSDYPDKKPLSAGVVNTTNAFLVGKEIPGVLGFQGTRREGQVSEYSFGVKLPASTNVAAATSGGETELSVDSVAGFPNEGALSIGTNPDGIDVITYTGIDTGTNEFTGCSGVGSYAEDVLVSQFYGEDTDKYIAGYDPISGNFGAVKSFRLVHIEGGLYDGSSTDYYASRVWGNIFPNPLISRDNKTVTFKVQDFGWMLTRKYDQNYPDQASYSMADYYEPHNYNIPDGASRPQCYDRWRTDRAIRDILYKAGVDPILLWQRERVQVSGSPTYAKDYGSYLLEGDLILDSKPHYGNPLSVESTQPDQRYIWTFGFGTYLWENISEIVKNFSYKFSFDSNGYAKAQSYGIADYEYYPDDTLGNLTFTGTSWDADDDNIGNLSAFRGRYRASSTAGNKASLAATYPYWSDAEIVLQRHDGASQKIKVKVGASYVTQLWIDGELVAGTGGGGDEFAIAALAAGTTWSYYDGLDSSTGENPSVIKLAETVSYDTQLLEVEVVSGEIRFNAFFIYIRSTRETVRTLDDSQMGSLRMEKDVINQRNEITIIGSEQGLAKSLDGDVINPLNPVYIHTVSRAVDLRSLYEDGYGDYIGHRMSSEIYDERVLDQERANYVAQHALTRYKGQEVNGTTSFLFDPRLDINDSISISDLHSKLLDTSQCWLLGITERYSVGSDGSRSYVTTLDEVSPRAPMPSMRFKPEPDIADWNNEPIVNLAIYYQGYRASGGDANTLSGSGITMDTDPGWPTNLWAGYFFVDHDGNEFEISGNTTDKINFERGYTSGVAVGNWAITFDPLDSESGKPIEIRYDQIKTGKIAVQIVGITGELISDLNKDTQDRVINWGPNKKIFWNGEIHHGYKEGRSNYLVSPDTLDRFDAKIPFAVRFSIEHHDSPATDVVTTHSADNNLETYYATPRRNGLVTTQNSFGAAKIVPKVLDDGYTFGWTALGNLSGSDNTILDAGRAWKVTSLGAGVYKFHLEGRESAGYNPWSSGLYDGKYVISGKSGSAEEIINSGADADGSWFTLAFPTTGYGSDDNRKVRGWSGSYNIFMTGEITETTDDADWFWVRIVENQYQPIMFNETDNAGRGLALKFTNPAFWVEDVNDTMFKSGVGFLVNLATNTLACENETTCEQELTINHEGSQYTIAKGSSVKLAHYGTTSKTGRYNNSDLGVDYRNANLNYVIFWSKYFPTRLWIASGNNADPHNPGEGTFVIASMTYSESSDDNIKTIVRCPVREPKANTFVMAPYLEIHQLNGNIDGTGKYNITNDSFEGFGAVRESDFEYKLPEFSSFLESRDLVVYLNPARLVGSTQVIDSEGLITYEETGTILYFWENLQSTRTPDYALWHFLIKLIVSDRVGRKPRNWIDFDVLDLADDEENFISAEFTSSDWNGISAFWYPSGSFTSYEIADGSNWWALIRLSSQLNLPRAVPLHIWKPT